MPKSINFLEDDNLKWGNYGFLLVGILYMGHFLYDLNHHYLKIENGTIRKNILYGFGKTIKLSEVYWIKKVAGEYILITDNHKFKISIDLIEENSLMELNKALGAIKLPADKTPFYNQVNGTAEAIN